MNVSEEILKTFGYDCDKEKVFGSKRLNSEI